MRVEPIASFEPVLLVLRWPAIAVLELVAVTHDVWAWRSEDGSWWVMRAGRA